MPAVRLTDAADLIEAVHGSPSAERFQAQLLAGLMRWRVTHLCVLRWVESGEGEVECLWPGNWPAAVLRAFAERRWYELDPLVVAVRRRGEPARRGDLASPPSPDVVVNRIRAEENAHGLADVVALPVRRGAEPAGAVLVAGPSEIFDAAATAALKILAPAVFARALEFRAEAAKPGHGPALTSREIDCLSWSARGKTSWEIGEILGVSEHTVTTHLRTAAIKLKAATRTHAVAEAMRCGMIS
jgi:LuxR family quorum sensing-dependent transcriptional regulator